MTGEVTDRFNEITLFGMTLFWQKAIEVFTKFIIHFLAYIECLFNSEFYYLLVLQISFRFDCWVAGRCAAKLMGGRGLLMVQLTSRVI